MLNVVDRKLLARAWVRLVLRDLARDSDALPPTEALLSTFFGKEGDGISRLESAELSVRLRAAAHCFERAAELVGGECDEFGPK